MGSLERKSYMGQLRIADLQADPSFWGEDSQRVLDWLAENYDPDTMPELQVVTTDGRDGYFLLGWRHEPTPWPPLLTLVYGQAYADKMIALNNRAIELNKAIAEHGTGQFGV